MARERYLLHEEEETINKPGAEIKLTTPKSKWDNFWFYHKWHVVIGAAVVLLVAFFIRDMLNQEHPDYQIGVITQNSYTDTVVEALEKKFEQVGEDLNQDGKVQVQVNVYTISDSDKADPNVQMASATKFTADLTEGMSMIFLTDDQSFQKQQKANQMFAYLDGATPPKDETDYTKMRVALKDCKLFQKFDTEAPTVEGKDFLENFSISMRVIKGSAVEGKADKEAYYASCKKMFDKIVKSEG